MERSTEESLDEYFVESLNSQTNRVVNQFAPEEDLQQQIKDAKGVMRNLRQLSKDNIIALFESAEDLNINLHIRVFKRHVGRRAEKGKRTNKGQLWDVTFLFKKKSAPLAKKED